jgi:hypothetical protein
MRTEQAKAVEHMRRAVTLFDELPDSAAKAQAHNELARLYLLQFRPAEAIATARPARELAERLGLSDAAATALVSESTARYLDADPTGVDGLERAVEVCRAQRLPQLRRASLNLSVLLLEEGDLRRAAELAAESRAADGGQASLVPSYSAEAEWAYFTGDWITLLHAADAYLDREDAESTEWDLQLRARRAWLRQLCGERTGSDIDRCLETGRRSGFTRLLFNACAHAALYHTLQGDDGCAAALLGELVEVWRDEPTTITVEWLSALAHTAALTPGTATFAAEVVATVPRRTRWVEAAEAMIAGALAAGRDDHPLAAREWVSAAARYDAIGGVSDAVLATAWAARALGSAGDAVTAAPHMARVRTFATRNRATKLLDLASAG